MASTDPFNDPFKDPETSSGKRKKLLKLSDLDVSGMSEADMYELHGRLTQLLPVKSIKDVDVEAELVSQMKQLQGLQMSVLREESNVPANQIAQVCNSLSTSLRLLADRQVSVYNSERLKKIEKVLIECLSVLPDDIQQAFLSKYESELEGL